MEGFLDKLIPQIPSELNREIDQSPRLAPRAQGVPIWLASQMGTPWANFVAMGIEISHLGLEMAQTG